MLQRTRRRMHRTRRACPRAQVYTPLCLAHVHSAKRNESGSALSILTVALLVASNHCRMEAFLGCEVNVHVSGSDEIKLKKCTWKHSTSGALSLSPNGWRQTHSKAMLPSAMLRLGILRKAFVDSKYERRCVAFDSYSFIAHLF